MRFMAILVIGTSLALPALAQTTHMQTKPHHTMRHSSTANRATAEDQGPFTPEANRAYQGGGVILEGAPGGPPPPASAATTPMR